MRTKFRRDGYDYIWNTDKAEYCVSKAFDVWCIWVNDEKQDEFFDYIADAKEWCRKHNERLQEA